MLVGGEPVTSDNILVTMFTGRDGLWNGWLKVSARKACDECRYFGDNVQY